MMEIVIAMRKCVEVEAFRFDYEDVIKDYYYNIDLEVVKSHFQSVVKIIHGATIMLNFYSNKSTFYINTLEGYVIIINGDWIVKEEGGEYCVVKPKVFSKKYAIRVGYTE